MITPRQFYEKDVQIGEAVRHSSGEVFVVDWYRPKDIKGSDLWLYSKRGGRAYLASECDKI